MNAERITLLAEAKLNLQHAVKAYREGGRCEIADELEDMIVDMNYILKTEERAS